MILLSLNGNTFISPPFHSPGPPLCLCGAFSPLITFLALSDRTSESPSISPANPCACGCCPPPSWRLLLMICSLCWLISSAALWQLPAFALPSRCQRSLCLLRNRQAAPSRSYRRAHFVVTESNVEKSKRLHLPIAGQKWLYFRVKLWFNPKVMMLNE